MHRKQENEPNWTFPWWSLDCSSNNACYWQQSTRCTILCTVPLINLLRTLFDQPAMRPHLVAWFEKGQFSPFPSVQFNCMCYTIMLTTFPFQTFVLHISISLSSCLIHRSVLLMLAFLHIFSSFFIPRFLPWTDELSWKLVWRGSAWSVFKGWENLSHMCHTPTMIHIVIRDLKGGGREESSETKLFLQQDWS